MRTIPGTEVQIITDDDEAKLFLVKLGIMDTVLEQEKIYRQKYSNKSGLTIQGEDATHWVLVDIFWGFGKPEDNGYAITLVPKSKFTKAQFIAKAAQLVADFYQGPIEVTVTKVKKPKN